MRRFGSAPAVVGIAVAVALLAGVATAQRSRRTAGYAWDDPNWRFTHHDRPVKVVLLAGSIGAFRDRPYGALIHQWCGQAEIRNVSRVGMGAPQLLSHFQRTVLQNPRVPVGARNIETWLLYGGGLNSVGMPARNNHAVHRLFRIAHRRNFRIVGLTVTPWGSADPDDDHWQGGQALHALRSTRQVVDFMMGRLSPAAALGRFADQRPRGVATGAAWTPLEQPDIAIDLYDSALRDRDAAPWSITDTRRRVSRDSRWRTQHTSDTAEERAQHLEADARFLTDAPRWFLRREYRSFDNIHPNRAGHHAMAAAMCPRLPESWGCECP